MSDRDDIAAGLIGGIMVYGAVIGGGIVLFIVLVAGLIYWFFVG